jgi:hypothetical protein
MTYKSNQAGLPPNYRLVVSEHYRVLSNSSIDQTATALIVDNSTEYNKRTRKLTFRGPCIVIYSYNKSQRDALILKFILVYNSDMFRTGLLSIIRSLVLYTQQQLFSIPVC